MSIKALLQLLVEGLFQVPHLSTNLIMSLSSLCILFGGSLPLATSSIIGLYLALQLVWCVLLWIRSVRVVGSQSVRRVLEAEARTATLTWLDVLRFGALAWVLENVVAVPVGVQICEVYCTAIAVRTLLTPLSYVVLRVYGGAALATRVTGVDPSAFVESMVGGGGARDAESGPAWRQHVQRGKEAASAAKRLTSLAPSAVSTDAQNNNDRCIVLDEGQHFNRIARGCLLLAEE
jgi:hypothetical protein